MSEGTVCPPNSSRRQIFSGWRDPVVDTVRMTPRAAANGRLVPPKADENERRRNTTEKWMNIDRLGFS